MFMNITYPRRSLPRKISRKIFWYTLDVVTHTLAHYWRNAEQYVPVVEHVRVPIANLPVPLHGLTIAHLSDFHSGPHVHAESLRHAAQMTMALRPDLIALTGDFVHRSVDYAMSCADALSMLRAPLGVHVVLGNHDYWKNPKVVAAQLQRVGLAPMRNEARRLERDGAAFYLLGVDDVRHRHADLDKALRAVPNDAFKILLVHEPDFADFAQGANIALQLSGHTHGGQIRLPYLGALLLPSWGHKYP